MKLLLSLMILLVTVGVLYSAPGEQPSNISEDTLKRELAKFPQVTCPGSLLKQTPVSLVAVIRKGGAMARWNMVLYIFLLFLLLFIRAVHEW